MTTRLSLGAHGTQFVTGPLVDHHCHALVLRDLDRGGFESLMNEAAGAGRFATSVFDSMIGLAVRRWCAPALGLEPHTSPEAYLARRAELGALDVGTRLLGAAGISDFIVDTGYVPEPIGSADDLASLGGGTSHEIVRLERIGESVLRRGVAPRDFADEVTAELAASKAVGTKSIAAYRTGLRVAAEKPTDDELVAALGELAPGSDGTFRIAHPVVNSYLAWLGIEYGAPLQFHVGYGDSDVDLLDCDPLLLTHFLRATAERGVPVMLLHNYPFHRHAAYLAQVFEHVFMDVGLAVHNTGSLSRHVIRESLELVPFAKLLYSSDAFGLPELYHLGALLFRRGLSQTLEDLVDSDEMAQADAARVADMVGRENAIRAYRLPSPE